MPKDEACAYPGGVQEASDGGVLTLIVAWGAMLDWLESFRISE